MASATETIASRYELLSVLGRGGMGVVYRGRDRVLDRIVAIKVLPAAYASDAILVQRFEREARAAARLNHPNIVAVFDTGRDGTVRYIVMECVAGESLAQRLNNRGALPIPEAVDFAAQIADALGAAHAAGIVHRDVKPANVMVQPNGVCKVLDFGIARAAAEAAMTRDASMLGSAPYMAPETALGETADARSDIYSLGCVLYEMLTGRVPFSGDLPAAVIHQHVSAVPRRPSEFVAALPPALDGLVMQMLAKDPAGRPQDAARAAAALRAALRIPAPAPAEVPTAMEVPTVVEPPLPPPPEQSPPPLVDAPPPGRRGRLPAGLIGVAAVVALLAGIAIALAASSATNDHGASTRTSHSTAATTSRQSTTPSSSHASSTHSSSTAKPSTSTSTTTVTSSPSTSSTATSSTSATSSSSSSSPTSTTP